MKLKYIIVSLIILFSCKEELYERDYPVIETGQVSLTSEHAVFKAEIISYNGFIANDHGFVWGTTKALYLQTADFKSLGEKTGGNSYSTNIDVSEFIEDETYYVRAYIVGNGKTVYGRPMAFSF